MKKVRKSRLTFPDAMIWVGTVRVPVNALRRSTFNVQRPTQLHLAIRTVSKKKKSFVAITTQPEFTKLFLFRSSLGVCSLARTINLSCPARARLFPIFNTNKLAPERLLGLETVVNLPIPLPQYSRIPHRPLRTDKKALSYCHVSNSSRRPLVTKLSTYSQ